jgi:hypothetical protein
MKAVGWESTDITTPAFQRFNERSNGLLKDIVKVSVKLRLTKKEVRYRGMNQFMKLAASTAFLSAEWFGGFGARSDRSRLGCSLFQALGIVTTKK